MFKPQKNLYSLLCIALSVFTFACDDTDEVDNTTLMVSGTEMAGTMIAGTEMAGTMIAGTEMAGTMIAGTEMAGSMIAGTEMAGSMIAGTEMAGSMIAGTDMAGMTMTPPDCSTSSIEAPCMVSIYSARQPSLVPDLTSVQIEGVITGVRINDEGNASHIVMQDPAGGAYSGIWVYLNDNEMEALPILNVGESIVLSGQVEDYFGQRQINTVTAISQLGAGAVVNSMLVNAADVATNGINAESMEGVLVTVQQVSVEAINPVAGPGDMDPTNEFVVTGNLKVDDFFFSYILPMVGQQYTSITGVMRLGNGDYKLIPRSVSDIQ